MAEIKKRDYVARTTDYGELKKIRSIALTDTAWEQLGKISKALGLSKSELVERTVRGIATPSPLQQSSEKVEGES